MSIVILSGVPGSGKSTWAKRYPDAVVCSADDFFRHRPFDPLQLGLAHQLCFRKFLDSMHKQVVVDNTNLTIGEIAPYYLAAESFMKQVVVVRISPPDFEVAYRRQTHGVPFVPFSRMVSNFLDRKVLP